jgi:aryl-alcohol dehydrogenase-like predicted oxidoreductase
LHRDYHDEAGNLIEVRALGDLIRAGKIRSFGLSNFAGWRIAEVFRLCEKPRAAARGPPAVLQPVSTECTGNRTCRPAAITDWAWSTVR